MCHEPRKQRVGYKMAALRERVAGNDDDGVDDDGEGIGGELQSMFALQCG